MVQLALRCALSDRAASGQVAVVEGWDWEVPSTKDALAALGALGLTGRVLVVLSNGDELAYKSFRNLAGVHLVLASELNAYDVLCSDWVVFTQGNLPGNSTWGEAPVPAPGTEPTGTGAAGTGAARRATRAGREPEDVGAAGTDAGTTEAVGAAGTDAGTTEAVGAVAPSEVRDAAAEPETVEPETVDPETVDAGEEAAPRASDRAEAVDEDVDVTSAGAATGAAETTEEEEPDE